MSDNDKVYAFTWGAPDGGNLERLRISLFHENCKSNFQTGELSNIKMALGTSIPLKLNQYLYTTEAFYPVNSKKMVSLIFKELKSNSSVRSLESWSVKKNVLKVSFIEKKEDSPLALIQPLGILQYNEQSQQGIDSITVVLHELNVRPMLDVLGTLGNVKIVRKYPLGENMLDFKYIFTEKEQYTLELAISMGYFDNPKRAYLKDIAKVLGVSIVAVDRNLRSAERKVILRNYPL